MDKDTVGRRVSFLIIRTIILYVNINIFYYPYIIISLINLITYILCRYLQCPKN